MAIGDNLSKRDQGLIGVAILAVGAAALYWYLAWSPKQAELAVLESRVDTLDAVNQKAKAQLARGSIKQLREQSQQFRENLELMRTLVPTGNEVPALLEQVSTAAKRLGMELGTVEPLPVVEGADFDTYRYRLRLTGSYHQVGEFMASVASLTRIIAPINLTLIAGAANPTLKLGPNQVPIAATFEIQTYVAKRSVPTTPPGGKKG